MKESKRGAVIGGKMKSILTRLADEFVQLALRLNSQAPITMEIGRFTQACHLVSHVIRHLGFGMELADSDYSAQVSVIEDAGNSVNTLKDLLDREIQQNIHTRDRSASRSLVRVKRSLDMLKIIFEQTRASRGNSIKDQVNTAYNQVFYNYHGNVDRIAFQGVLLCLPTRSEFFEAVNLDEASAFAQMQRTVIALTPLIDYINNLFHSRPSARELLNWN